MSGRRRLIAAVAVAALMVLVAGAVTVVVRHGSSSSGHGSHAAARPAAAAPARSAIDVAVDSYYTALEHADAPAAYRLLCTRQQIGLAAYTANIATNVRTGTGVTGFRRTGSDQVQGDAAGVPGQIMLADGESLPLLTLLSSQDGHWLVCSSDRGGVLPPPGQGGGGSSATPTPSPAASV